MGLDLARALLFYAQRRDYLGGGYGPYEPFRALVQHIREQTGGVVRHRHARARTLDADDESSGSAVVGEFTDSWQFSPDGVYRWWYERRWAPGPTLCFVGLNPSTGDTDGKPRPTLRKVVGWAKREGCGAVVVVNLFAFRATKPDALFSSGHDIVGHLNDEMIERCSRDASITLAAWGANPRARSRASEVLPLLTDPHCVGTAKFGAPLHPLYIASSTPLVPYR